VLVFDEEPRHAPTHAGGKACARRPGPAQKGRAGLRLQHALPQMPTKRALRTANGARRVHNFAYASAWGFGAAGEDFPFATRADRAGDLGRRGSRDGGAPPATSRRLGLYAARSPLIPEGVVYELVEPRLTQEQVRIYERICRRLPGDTKQPDRRVEAANGHREGPDEERAGQIGARSAFESAKQRFSTI